MIKHILLNFRGLALGCLLLSVNSPIHADTKTTFSIETDPATFLWDGYAAHLRIAPRGTPHWTFGTGIYSLVLPDLIVNMEKANRNQEWKVQLKQGLGLFAEYFLSSQQKGWFAGGQLAHQTTQLSSRNSEMGVTEYSALLFMTHAGYRWFPFNKNHLYFQPWAGLGYNFKYDGSSSLNGKEYTVAPILAFATLHVGYRF